MRKIQTIFERDANMKITQNKKVDVSNLMAFEKVDGTNIRITVRNHTLVRVEKRRNPTKLEKAKGIVTPWYVDVDPNANEDKYILEAASWKDLSDIPDGEWSAEAYGEKIQGNPLRIEGRRIFIFSYEPERNNHLLKDVPSTFEELKEWLPLQRSTFNPEVGIEGIVWWNNYEPVGKIKVKDFKI